MMIPSFSKVAVRIPNELIHKVCWEDEKITSKQLNSLMVKKRQIERAIDKLRHVDSLIEKIFIREYKEW